MRLIAELEDDQYEYQKADHVRIIARAVLINEEQKVAVIRLHGQDIFGSRNYYELPGGGVNENESLLEGVKRELAEEIGYTSELIAEIGLVKDYYNLIKRENHNYYFLMKTKNKVPVHLEEMEKSLIAEILWLSIDEAIAKFESHSPKGLPKLLKQRELPILLEAKAILSK